VPAAQKKPAGHASPAGDATPATQYVPALHGFDVAATLAAAVQKPAAHAPHDAALT
jgi:hypothetical protein